MNKKPFFKQINFYLLAGSVLLTFIALLLYAVNCPSEFNGNKASSSVITLETLAIVCGVLSLGGAVLTMFFPEDSLVGKIVSYRRFLNYLTFFLMLGAFFMQILDEYPLLGTILYPIVSGAVGDPVDPTLAGSYFASLIMALVALVLAAVSGGALRRRAAKISENAAPEAEGVENA